MPWQTHYKMYTKNEAGRRECTGKKTLFVAAAKAALLQFLSHKQRVVQDCTVLTGAVSAVDNVQEIIDNCTRWVCYENS